MYRCLDTNSKCGLNMKWLASDTERGWNVASTVSLITQPGMTYYIHQLADVTNSLSFTRHFIHHYLHSTVSFIFSVLKCTYKLALYYYYYYYYYLYSLYCPLTDSLLSWFLVVLFFSCSSLVHCYSHYTTTRQWNRVYIKGKLNFTYEAVTHVDGWLASVEVPSSWAVPGRQQGLPVFPAPCPPIYPDSPAGLALPEKTQTTFTHIHTHREWDRETERERERACLCSGHVTLTKHKLCLVKVTWPEHRHSIN